MKLPMHPFITAGAVAAAMAIVSVSLPDDLCRAMDDTVEARKHKGRSELVRTAVRGYLQAEADLPKSHAHGSITVVYRHGNEARISEARHAFHDVVLSMMHTHCEPDVCMDVLLVGGDGRRIVELQQRLQRMRDVLQAALVPVLPTAGTP